MYRPRCRTRRSIRTVAPVTVYRETYLHDFFPCRIPNISRNLSFYLSSKKTLVKKPHRTEPLYDTVSRRIPWYNRLIKSACSVPLNSCSNASNMTRHSSWMSCCCHASLESHPKLRVRSVVSTALRCDVCGGNKTTDAF